MKYKLIKEYPGSPELGTVHSSENKTNEWKGIGFYVSHPEYWKEVTHLHYVVFKCKFQSFEPWKVYGIECIPTSCDYRKNFKTAEEAEEFILYNKPCLSYADIIWEAIEDTKKDSITISIEKLINLVKSKL